MVRPTASLFDATPGLVGPHLSSEQSWQHPVLSGRFGCDAASPLGRVDLGGTRPSLVLERGA